MDRRALAALLRVLRSHGVTSYSAGEVSIHLDPYFERRKGPKERDVVVPVEVDAPKSAQAQLLSDLFAHEGS